MGNGVTRLLGYYQVCWYVMATCGKDKRLSNKQIQRWGAAISQPNMESIAMGFFDIDYEIIMSARAFRVGDTQAFNWDMIVRWANRNPANQVEVWLLLLIK